MVQHKRPIGVMTVVVSLVVVSTAVDDTSCAALRVYR